MALPPGVKLGPYEITGSLGAGAMGEVYRATDTNLKREVAIKVLHRTVASDADTLARFQREAEVLAALNHPHIAAIYGLERTDVATALVMELVDGPTLADRIGGGPVPVEEAIDIARQVAAALEAAHERGIVHRDLKPANIKVRSDGTVKVLDFGLAKAMQPGGAAASNGALSPTITAPLMTGAGVLLGTPAYMSPEQARGTAVDKRSDIWAFGAVLYEMLSGRRAFAGSGFADVLASVLAHEPDWTRLPARIPPGLIALIRGCLQKDRAQRIRDIGDVSLALDGAFGVVPLAQPSTRSSRWRWVMPVAGSVVATALIAGFLAWTRWPSPTPRRETRFDYVLPDGQQLPSTQRPVIAIAADGQSFLYQTASGLYLRSMGDLQARLLPGTEESLLMPILSPDGQWVAYFAAGHLKKMAVRDGATVTLSAATTPFGVTWTPHDTILFGQAAGIMRVSADGGTPDLIVPAAQGEQVYGPQLLPGGHAVLFSVTRSLGPNRWDEAQIVVQDLSSHQRTVVVQGGSDARYLKTGHIVYALRDGLFAVGFDAAQLKVTSGAVPLVQGVQPSVGVAAAASNYSVSDDGTLVYLTESQPLRSLVWMDRAGTAATPIAAIPAGMYQEPRLSPDGSRVLVTRGGDIWVYELASGRNIRVTTDGTSLMGVWNPAGSQIAYSSARGGNLEAWLQPLNGTVEPQQLTSLGGQVHVDAWSPDGGTLMLHRHPPQQGPVDIFMLRMDRSGTPPEIFLPGGASEESAQLSRDGQYVSYLLTDSDQREVYLRPYRRPGQPIPVSVGGGREPVWAGNGDLFYRSSNGEKVFVVSVTTAPALKVGPPVQLFEGHWFIAPTGSPRAQYDVSADAQRLLMLAPTTAGTSPQRPRLVVVQNWFAELASKVPGR